MTDKTTKDWWPDTREEWLHWQRLVSEEHDRNVAKIERLRRGLNEVRDFLNKPEWGTYRYMEGTGVYEDKDAALFNIAYALGETDANS